MINEYIVSLSNDFMRNLTYFYVLITSGKVLKMFLIIV